MPAAEPYDLTISEAAARVGVHQNTLIRWADQGKVPCARTPGGHRRFRASDLARLVAPEPAPALA